MKTKFYNPFITALFAAICTDISAQNIFPASGSAGIGTTTPNTSSALEIKSTTQGLLISRMTKAQRDAIVSPTEGLMIYQTNNTPGFYYYTGAAWTAVTPKSKGWLLTGNNSADPATNFIGTIDALDFVIRTNNQERIRILSNGDVGIGTSTPVFKLDVKGGINATDGYHISGETVLSVNGIDNTFVGVGSGFNTILAVGEGSSNSATGHNALYSNINGSWNTATGDEALYSSIGNGNTANGYKALYNNTTGSYNTANGYGALFFNTTGFYNTANGCDALNSNTTGSYNTACGYLALGATSVGSNATAIGYRAMAQVNQNNTSTPFINYNVAVGYEALRGSLVGTDDNTGNYNTALGYQTLLLNNTGNNNTANGYQALLKNRTGSANTASGVQALYTSYTGNNNVAIGYNALYNSTTGEANTCVGTNAGSNLTTGSFNTFLGMGANSGLSGTLNNSTAIGNGATVTGSNIFVFGNSSVIGWGFGVESGIRALKVGTTASNGNSAYLTVGGTWTNASARSKKEDFQKQDRNAILAKINQLEITKWKYKGTDNEYHYGPMADDFYRLFKVGDDSSISDMDKTGVLFLGMQTLSEENKNLKSEIAELKSIVQQLQQNFTSCNACIQQSTSVNQQSINKTSISLSSASLEQNIPNPFTNSTTINYSLPKTYSSAKIIVVDKAGKVLKEISVSGSGKGSLKIDASTLASGAYQYSLYVNGKLVDTKQMLISK